MLRSEVRTPPIITDRLIAVTFAEAWGQRVTRPDHGPRLTARVLGLAARLRVLAASWRSANVRRSS